MTRRRLAAIVLICLFLLILNLLTACKSGPEINGRWRSEPPSSLLYEYRDDGTVFLLKEETSYQVFRYELFDDNSLRLYDGMGRIQEYEFQITGDRLSFYADLDKVEIVDKFRREK